MIWKPQEQPIIERHECQELAELGFFIVKQHNCLTGDGKDIWYFYQSNILSSATFVSYVNSCPFCKADLTKPTTPTFEELLAKVKDFGKNHPTYYGCGLTGEAGEVANLLKKLERDGLDKTVAKITNQKPSTTNSYHTHEFNKQIFGEKLGEELVDTMIYIELVARQFPDVDLKQSMIKKLHVIDERLEEN